MIPIGDSNSLRRTPVMNWLLITANVLVFFYELTLSSRALDSFFLTWGVIPQNVLAALAEPLSPGSLHVLETLLTSHRTST